jgi:hypothetical protein
MMKENEEKIKETFFGYLFDEIGILDDNSNEKSQEETKKRATKKPDKRQKKTNTKTRQQTKVHFNGLYFVVSIQSKNIDNRTQKVRSKKVSSKFGVYKFRVSGNSSS